VETVLVTTLEISAKGAEILLHQNSRVSIAKKLLGEASSPFVF